MNTPRPTPDSPTVNVGYMRLMVTVLRSRGLDVAALLDAAGLGDEAALAARQTALSLREIDALVAAATRAGAGPFLGLDVGAALRVSIARPAGLCGGLQPRPAPCAARHRPLRRHAQRGAGLPLARRRRRRRPGTGGAARPGRDARLLPVGDVRGAAATDRGRGRPGGAGPAHRPAAARAALAAAHRAAVRRAGALRHAAAGVPSG